MCRDVHISRRKSIRAPFTPFAAISSVLSPSVVLPYEIKCSGCNAMPRKRLPRSFLRWLHLAPHISSPLLPLRELPLVERRAPVAPHWPLGGGNISLSAFPLLGNRRWRREGPLHGRNTGLTYKLEKRNENSSALSCVIPTSEHLNSGE